MANRIEPTAETSAATGDAKAAPAASGIKAWLPLILTVVLMPVLAYGMTSFVLLPKLQKGLGITPGDAVAEATGKGSTSGKKESASLEKLLVNVAGTMGQRYLLVSLSVEGVDPQFQSKMLEARPRLKDVACGTLAIKTLADLEKPTARNLIRAELISAFNGILGGPVVQEIYFTEFAIQ